MNSQSDVLSAMMQRLQDVPLVSEEEDTRLSEEKRVASLLAASERQLASFPKRFKGVTFDDYQRSEISEVANKQEKLISILRSGRSLVMFGNNGTGKTMLAFASLREQVLANKEVCYVTAIELFDEVRMAFGNEGSKKVAQKYANPDYLVIDEVDKSYGSATEFITITRIVDMRYLDLKPTVLIANADDVKDGNKYIIDVCGRSAYERIVEEGTAVYMDWESHRRKK